MTWRQAVCRLICKDDRGYEVGDPVEAVEDEATPSRNGNRRSPLLNTTGLRSTPST